MRPITLSDESLDDLDQDDLDIFNRTSTDHGRRMAPSKTSSALDDLDDEPEADEEILDLVAQMDAGVVDYD